jgi:arsenate reductase (glutaredoxin)
VKIYHNARCSKSREACELLSNSEIEVEVVDYIKQPLTESELTNLIDMLGVKAFDIIRQKEDIFIKYYRHKNPKRVNWVKAILKHPILMERPILVSGNKAIIGRPPKLVLEI